MVCLGPFSLKCVEHNTGGSNDELGEDFKWHTDTALNDNELLETCDSLLSLPRRISRWLVGC